MSETNRLASDPVNYHGGLRYAHLERETSKPDYLTQIFGRMPE